MAGPRKQSGGLEDSGWRESRPRPQPAPTPLTGLVDDPLYVLLESMVSGSDDTIVETLRVVGIRLLTKSRRPLLAATLGALPPELRRSDPTLLVLEAMLCRLDGDYDNAIRLSAAAQAVVDESGTDELAPDTADWISLLMLWRSRCGWADPHEAVARVRARLGCGHGLSKVHTLGPGASSEWSSWLMVELASVQIMTGDLEEASLHVDEVIGNARNLGNDRLLAAALAHRSLLELVDGSYQTAANTARGSLALTDTEGSASLPHIACAHLVIAWASLQELDVVVGREHLAAAEAEPPLALDPLLTQIARLLHIKLLAKDGSLQEALRVLAEHRPSPRSDPPFLQRLSLLTSAQVVSMSGDVAEIRRHAAAFAELGYFDEAELFGAVAETGAGKPEVALDRVEALLARPRLDPPVAAGAAALRVALLLRVRRGSRAADALPDLLGRVASQRMLHILSTAYLGGAEFLRLLEAEARHPDGHPFATEALEALSRYDRSFYSSLGLKRHTVGNGVVDGASKLTPREREVLAELSLGGSYADVAAALFLSENTVKTHLTSAYRKLGVDRRVDALRVARENHVL